MAFLSISHRFARSFCTRRSAVREQGQAGPVRDTPGERPSPNASAPGPGELGGRGTTPSRGGPAAAAISAAGKGTSLRRFRLTMATAAAMSGEGKRPGEQRP